ncbi:MAG: TIGR03067 domain-containing protein [Gemmataceae bacterium]
MFLALLSAVLVPLLDDMRPDSDLSRVEGRWVVVSCEIDGKPYAEFLEARVAFSGKMSSYTLKNNALTDSARFTMDASRNPKTIEFVGASYTELGIYAFRGDELIICVALPTCA